MKTRIHTLTLLLAAGLSTGARAIEADTPESSCKEIMGLVSKQDYQAALEEARWCVQALENSIQGEVAKFFKENVAGWKRTNFQEQNAMGMATISSTYEKDGKRLNVSLMGQQGSGSGFGAAMGNFAKMGMMQAGKRFRVQRLAATADNNGNIMVMLDDGSFFQIESRDYNTADEALNGLEPFLDAFPFAEINKTRK